jgi:RCC1 and BTB domain-containing protein
MEVYACGRGEDGQLGVGDTTDRFEPKLLTHLKGKDVVQIGCGSGHTVALVSEGKVYTWGRGDDGRLAHGDSGWQYVPRLVVALSNRRIIRVACGSYHTAAISEDGELFTFGGGMYGKLGHGSECGHSLPCRVEALVGRFVTQVACGSRHTVALTREDSEVFAWGDSENGVSGVGDNDGQQYTPRLVEELCGQNTVQISACGFHSAAVTQAGRVFSWGDSKFGRLGYDSVLNVTNPQLIEALREVDIEYVACGGFHTAAITKTGEMYTWGGGEHGQVRFFLCVCVDGPVACIVYV